MSQPRATSRSVDDNRVNVIRYAVLVLGILFLVIGAAGFLVTGVDQFAARTGETLMGFEVNPLHNIVHLAFGIAGVVMWRRLDTARAFGWIVVVAYGVVLVYGVVVANKDEGNILSLNSADNWLHLAFVVIGLVIALLPVAARRVDRTDAGRPPY